MKKVKEWIEQVSPEIIGYGLIIGGVILSITLVLWSVSLLIKVVGGML